VVLVSVPPHPWRAKTSANTPEISAVFFIIVPDPFFVDVTRELRPL
jgi:hypothetical protein